ncbi:MAG TPA: hypothetical protein VLF94_00095 [Chlamydiales bacterium]|nr:hypothetical protein [Chlamydiales bacterium]
MAITSRGHLQTRLQNVFSSISHDSLDAPLYTKQFDKEREPSLVATFDNGIDPEPAFSGAILAKLYLDEEHNLSLATWPLDKAKNPPWRKEILLSHVESFTLEFLGKNSASEHGKREKIRPINANFAWRTLWSKSESEVPSIIRLSVYEEKSTDPLRFAFILPKPERPITYLGGKT